MNECDEDNYHFHNDQCSNFSLETSTTTLSNAQVDGIL